MLEGAPSSFSFGGSENKTKQDNQSKTPNIIFHVTRFENHPHVKESYLRVFKDMCDPGRLSFPTEH